MKNIIIIGYPKSGNTWINYLLAYSFNAKYFDAPQEEQYLKGGQLPLYKSNDDLQARKFRDFSPQEIAHVVKSHLAPNDMKKQYPKTIKKCNIDFECDSLINIIRDPRDIAVSSYYYKYFYKNWAKNGKTSMNPGMGLLPYNAKEYIAKKVYFNKHARLVAKGWSEFQQKINEIHPFVVLYESLLANTVGEIEKICNHFLLHFNSEHVERAVRYCSFNNLQKKEKTKTKYSNEKFFRKGESGQWKYFFNKRLLMDFTEEISPLFYEYYQ